MSNLDPSTDLSTGRAPEGRVNAASGGEGAPACVHHWLLEDPADGLIRGRCLRCDGRRQFPAHVEDAPAEVRGPRAVASADLAAAGRSGRRKQSA